MTFGEKLKSARLEAGMKQSELAKLLKVGNTAVSSWERDVSKPDLDTLVHMCGILGVNIPYFLESQLLEYSVTIPEYNHIKKYRSLDSYGKETVSYILDREAERSKDIIREEKAIYTADKVVPLTRKIPDYQHFASAGTGQLVFDDVPTEQIDIPDIAEYKLVKYSIRVRGNSMEDKYSDNDRVLAEKTDQINVGEIGVFIVDGESYIKQLGNGELISLNPKYKPVPLTLNTVCMGKVVGKLETDKQ